MARTKTAKEKQFIPKKASPQITRQMIEKIKMNPNYNLADAKRDFGQSSDLIEVSFTQAFRELMGLS